MNMRINKPGPGMKVLHGPQKGKDPRIPWHRCQLWPCLWLPSASHSKVGQYPEMDLSRLTHTGGISYSDALELLWKGRCSDISARY